MSDLARDALPDDLARENKFQWLTRIGFLARGLLYITIGVLAIGTGRTEDLTGALEYVGSGTGRILLIIIAAGLATYALWRLSDGAFGTEHGQGDWKAIRKRSAAASIGLIYLYMSYKAANVLLSGRSGAAAPEQHADTVLDLPGGWIMLGIFAAFMLGAGVLQLIKAWKCSFLRNLDAECITPAVKWLGRIGYAARGIVFLCVGWLLGRAAWLGRSSDAGGMEQALDMLSEPILFAVAAGLMLFGAFSLVEARYRVIHRPPDAGEVADKVRGKVGG
jgi:hypothetical protein